MISIYWLIALAVLLLIEIITLGLTTIWFAGGALIAFLISLVINNIFIEAAAFFIVSILLLYFTRPIAMKYFNTKRVKTNYESLIDQEAKVIEKIDNFNESGQVNLNGQVWTARAVDEHCIIEPQQRVVVRDIVGVKLIVEVKKEER